MPFADLPDDVAEYDRMFVRAIPKILAMAGIQVIRTAAAPATVTE